MSESPGPGAASAEPVQPTPADSAETATRDRIEAAARRPTPLALLAGVAAIALAVVAWQWYDSRTQVNALKEELARRLSEAEARNRDAVTTAHSVRERVRELSGKIEVVESGLAESQNQQVALEAL